MKKIVIAVFLCILITGFATLAHAELDIFLARLNDQAADDMPRKITVGYRPTQKVAAPVEAETPDDVAAATLANLRTTLHRN